MTALSEEARELAQRLMVEITARLEDLAAEAAGLQRQVEPAPKLIEALADVLRLAEAREALVR